MKNVFIILGNGFSIDFLNHLKDTDVKAKEISLSNLFENGELVPWPGNGKPGFLSYKYCPNLWTLGARPNLNATESINLIENIITCANALNNRQRNVDSIYMRAYKELVTYLKALFIFYNDKINVPNINLANWGWSKYLKTLSQNPEISNVHIVTLNYDIWLERILRKNDIDFSITNFDQPKKVIVYKPHGSISFSHSSKKVKEAFEISYEHDILDGKLSEFTVEYDNLSVLNSINAMIPPAGDSHRLDFAWAKDIRESIINVSSGLTVHDELVICGTSYWHVDRLEMDRILTSIDSNINDVKVINPYSPNVFNAVVTTLFKNVTFFKNSNPLGEL
ncbi:hypothetical protein [Aeromonas dhakensis]|uniref:hypothetical protein n=2 Tax=Aeromonas TaxID=642 RepID=UPI001959E8D0|nr:hypothetical protein [Aeromonas dhakensis]